MYLRSSLPLYYSNYDGMFFDGAKVFTFAVYVGYSVALVNTEYQKVDYDVRSLHIAS